MFYSLLFGIIGFILFQFIFWKRLKEDYSSELIFSVSFLSSIVWFSSKYLFTRLLPNYWFWLSFTVALLVFVLVVQKLKMRFYETLEAFIISVLSYLIVFFLHDAVVNESIFSFAHSVFIFAICFLFIFLDTRYKNFSWYKSGRVGFSGLITLGSYMLVRSVLVYFFPFMLSFASFDIYISTTVAFISFFLVYNLARNI